MAGSHGSEFWFDTDLGDEYYIFVEIDTVVSKYTAFTTLLDILGQFDFCISIKTSLAAMHDASFS